MEDIRSPQFVIEQLQLCAKEGFISVPNKHTEFSHVESTYWLGYSHHRWIFTVQSVGGVATLRGIAKFPIVNYFSEKSEVATGASWGRFFSKTPKKPAEGIWGPGLDWVDSSKVNTQGEFANELGFLWKDDLPFEWINGDFAGESSYELADLYRNQLRDGI